MIQRSIHAHMYLFIADFCRSVALLHFHIQLNLSLNKYWTEIMNLNIHGTVLM